MVRAFLGFLLALGLTSAQAAEDSWWRALDLRGVDGAAVKPSGRWIVVVFLSPECPVANAEIPVLNALAARFAPPMFQFLGAYADPHLETAAIAHHVADYRLGFAAVDDRGQRLARRTGAAWTPEVCVLSRDGHVLYRGRIDDRVQDFGGPRPAATREDLREVLEALAAGRTGPFPDQPGFGCTIPGLGGRDPR